MSVCVCARVCVCVSVFFLWLTRLRYSRLNLYARVRVYPIGFFVNENWLQPSRPCREPHQQSNSFLLFFSCLFSFFRVSSYKSPLVDQRSFGHRDAFIPFSIRFYISCRQTLHPRIEWNRWSITIESAVFHRTKFLIRFTGSYQYHQPVIDTFKRFFCCGCNSACKNTKNDARVCLYIHIHIRKNRWTYTNLVRPCLFLLHTVYGAYMRAFISGYFSDCMSEQMRMQGAYITL